MAKQTSNTKRSTNYFTTIASVTLLLLLAGLLGLLVVMGNELVRFYKEDVKVIAEIKPDNTRDTIKLLETHLEKSAFAKSEKVVFVSKERVLSEMRDYLGEDFMKLDLTNPFYDHVEFNVKAEYMNPDSLAIIKSNIKAQFPIISDIYAPETMINRITDNLGKIQFWIFIALLLFSLITFVLIGNTIRLSLSNNRSLIKNMELVGASWGFISKPFLMKAVWIGLVSGFIAIAILISLVLWLQSAIGWNRIDVFGGMYLVFGILLLGGVGISVLSTYFVVNKTLRLRSS